MTFWRTRSRATRGLALAAILAAVLVGLVVPGAGRPADAAKAAISTGSVQSAGGSKVNGSGSQYVALAMQQWVAEGQTRGLQVNYLPIGSPQGLTAFGQSLVDFAATEAEFSALHASGGEQARGFQYVPDVAGATAVLYNAEDKAGREVDYLHLSRRTIARIFTGDIANWNDPAITADNKGVQLPDHPITVVYRSAQSGTTGTFYDFVAHVAPDIFGPWAARYNLPTDVRIIQLDSAPDFAPHTLALGGSDQIAQYIQSAAGKWSIGYDEFGYAKTYGVNAAWVQNQSGNWVQPYAVNIAAALESAQLRPDLSQELSGVYTSGNPEAYPISAYSYLVTQCAPAGDRPTCKGDYSNPGVSQTLAEWMRYIACDGQVAMASIGYSPLPVNLSQEMANSIARMQGTTPEVLTPDNCSNPQFHGSIGEGGSPPADPLDEFEPINEAELAPSDPTAAVATNTDVAASSEVALGDTAGIAGVTKAVGGGSTNWRDATPAAYLEPDATVWSGWPLVLVLGALVLPPAVVGISSRIRRRRT